MPQSRESKEIIPSGDSHRFVIKQVASLCKAIIQWIPNYIQVQVERNIQIKANINNMNQSLASNGTCKHKAILDPKQTLTVILSIPWNQVPPQNRLNQL